MCLYLITKVKELLRIIYLLLAQTTDVDIEHEVEEIEQSAPYIAITGMPGTEEAQYHICCEKQVVTESRGVRDAVLDLMCCYFVFDTSYPKRLSSILVYIQHFLLGVKSSQKIPEAASKLASNRARI